ncbi:hypothetical protein [Staphylococcus equorum]|uniref:hypothetical protein n=1 Tax=Staphylococcus equorum TaxID=246432 RepID=UPI0012D83B2F
MAKAKIIIDDYIHFFNNERIILKMADLAKYEISLKFNYLLVYLTVCSSEATGFLILYFIIDYPYSELDYP